VDGGDSDESSRLTLNVNELYIPRLAGTTVFLPGLFYLGLRTPKGPILYCTVQTPDFSPQFLRYDSGS